MPDVSVIITSYNRHQWVGDAIESVLSQTAPVREVVVVDDGSTDETPRVLASFGDRIRVVFQKNQGGSAARNTGVQFARGSWVGFLDDDDVWLKDKVEKQLSLIQQDLSLGLVYTSDYAVDENLRILHPREARPENRGDVFEKLLKMNFICSSSVLVRRDLVLKAGGLDAKLKWAYDWDLWLKVVAGHHADFAPQPLVYVRHVSRGCLTKDLHASLRMAEMQTVFERGCKLRKPSFDTLRRGAFRIRCGWSYTWLEAGNRPRALSAAMSAIPYRPLSSDGYRLAAKAILPTKMQEAIASLRNRNGRKLDGSSRQV